MYAGHIESTPFGFRLILFEWISNVNIRISKRCSWFWRRKNLLKDTNWVLETEIMKKSECVTSAFYDHFVIEIRLFSVLTARAVNIVEIIKFIGFWFLRKRASITLIALNTSKRKCSIFNPLFVFTVDSISMWSSIVRRINALLIVETSNQKNKLRRFIKIQRKIPTSFQLDRIWMFIVWN